MVVAVAKRRFQGSAQRAIGRSRIILDLCARNFHIRLTLERFEETAVLAGQSLLAVNESMQSRERAVPGSTL